MSNLENLIYIGTSIPNQRQNPLAAKLKFCTAEELTQIKLAHDDYEEFLDEINKSPFIQEISLVSTCNRFEIIFFLNQEINTDEQRKYIAEEIRKSIIEFINQKKEEFLFNEDSLGILYGNESKLQIIRTYCGLNSGLVGESEICLQINGAFKQALKMGYLKEQGEKLFNEIVAYRNFFDKEIYKNPVSYCDVAIQKAFMSLSLMSPINTVTILGSGSTAIQSSLALVKNKIKAEDITLIHRVSSSSQQIEYFKNKAELSGMQFIRSKKHGYKSPKISQICSISDLVVFGIDARSPVIQFPSRGNQVIFDFNSNPSCTFDGKANHNYFSLPKLDAFVREFSFRQNNDFELTNKLNLAETELQKRFFQVKRDLLTHSGKVSAR